MSEVEIIQMNGPHIRIAPASSATKISQSARVGVRRSALFIMYPAILQAVLH